MGQRQWQILDQFFCIATVLHGHWFESRFSTISLFSCLFYCPILYLADTTPPVISGISDIFTTVPSGSTGTTISWTEPTATDDSGVVTLTGRTHQPGTFFNVGTTTVTYTFTDGSGNSATTSFNVVVSEESGIWFRIVLLGTARHSIFDY